MKEYPKEQNMRRENDPVSTTLDVGLNNNQLVRDIRSSTGSEDTENENFWVTDGVGLSANYEWCCESVSSIDDHPRVQKMRKRCPNRLRLRKVESDQPRCLTACDTGFGNFMSEFLYNALQMFFLAEESSSEYDLGWDEENRPSDWRSDSATEKTSVVRESEKKISRELPKVQRTSGELDYRWNNSETRDDNAFNNNEASDRSIAGESVNQLDVCKNEEKIFYEKPKLNIQTVTYLYDSVLPPAVKCLNYVNSIKVSKSLENPLTIEKEEDKEEKALTENEILKIQKNPIVVDETANLTIKNLIKKPKLMSEDSGKIWREIDENATDVEILELTKSVKDIIQFPEIEEIADSIKFNDKSEDSSTETTTTTTTTTTIIEGIDLLREAEELSHNGEKTSENLKISSNYNESVANCDEKTLNIIEEIDLLSSIGRDIGVDLEKYVQPIPDVVAMDSFVEAPISRTIELPVNVKNDKARGTDTNKLANKAMPDVSSCPDTRKKEKMARNQARRRQNCGNSMTSGQTRRNDSKRRADHHIVDPGGFDVYNIETAMPKIDLDAIESHLRAAREEERRENERVAEVVEAVAAGREPESKNPEKEDLLARFNRLLDGQTNVSYQRRNDREEIRRRLAMGPDAEDLRAERGRKPSLQSRLQSGMNLQICFMNETPSDTESPGSESDATPGPVSLSSFPKLQRQQNSHKLATRPQILSLPSLRVDNGTASGSSGPMDEADFFSRQARLQTEARMALAQAKEMAHMQMEVERQRLKQSPITEMVRSSLEKVGVQLGEDRRRLSRVLLTELNVAQLQVVANDLHARIAMLNEALVEGLLRRDDLHMEQDSMLVDVEDLTRYLGAKQETPRKRSSSGERRQQQRSLPGTSKLRGNQASRKSNIEEKKILGQRV